MLSIVEQALHSQSAWHIFGG